MENYGKAGVPGTIAVPSSGWTDLGEIRQVRQRWLQREPSLVA
jgi:hypothetical protein